MLLGLPWPPRPCSASEFHPRRCLLWRRLVPLWLALALPRCEERSTAALVLLRVRGAEGSLPLPLMVLLLLSVQWAKKKMRKPRKSSLAGALAELIPPPSHQALRTGTATGQQGR